MKIDHLKLLIIGGYGTFGGRLVRLLSDQPELTILVAGRALHKAVELVSAHVGLATLIPLQFDRDGDVGRQLKDQLPDIVIDASLRPDKARSFSVGDVTKVTLPPAELWPMSVDEP